MDLMPPLTRSPESTPMTYCPSEASSSEYDSPRAVEQQYSISSIYNPGSLCPMASTLRSEATSQTDWKWDTTTVAPSSQTAVPMTSVLNANYDSFDSYEPSLPHSYPDDIYGTRPQRSPAPILYHDSVYPRTPMKLEGMDPENDNSMASSQYPSPSIAHSSYAVDTSSNSMLPPPAQEPRLPTQQNGGYVTGELSSSDWSKSSQYEASHGHFHMSENIQQSLLPLSEEARNGSQTGGRNQRAPRRLTTKEEANFRCDVNGCGKLFSRSYNFKAHMETHCEDRDYPFPCQMQDCSKKFVRKTDLQRHHKSVHQKKRDHECEDCKRRFARKDTLSRHRSDGCHRRFDIGIVDFRAQDQEQAKPRSYGFYPPPTLPPLSMPPVDSDVPSASSQYEAPEDLDSKWKR